MMNNPADDEIKELIEFVTNEITTRAIDSTPARLNSLYRILEILKEYRRMKADAELRI